MTISRVRTLVSTNWVREKLMHLQDSKAVRILDTTWTISPDVDDYKEYYKEAHIPGAKHFDLNRCVDSTSLIPRNIPNPKCFAEYVGSLGISSDTHIIAYDRNNSRPSVRTWWLFRMYGHDKISVLDGGMSKWLENGYEISDDEQPVEKAVFTPNANPILIRDFKAMTENLKTKKEQVVDARSAKEFHGESEVPEGMNAGHIPGAKNLPYEDIFNDDGTFKSEKDLKKLFDLAGVDLGKPLVTSCFAGLTACGLAAAAHILGKNIVPIYYGSWKEWGQKAPACLCVTGK